MDDRREARAEGGWRFHAKRRGNNGKRSRHGHGYPSPRDKELPACPGSVEDEGMRLKSEVGWRHSLREIFRCHPHLGLNALKDNKPKENFVFNASRDWKPMELLLGNTGSGDRIMGSKLFLENKRHRKEEAIDCKIPGNVMVAERILRMQLMDKMVCNLIAFFE